MASKASGPRLASSDLTVETNSLRIALTKFLDVPFPGSSQRVGSFKFGVYMFFDFDREPIYVGQTTETLRIRIQRHLTNQRTDAVAMNVLDPFEVFEVAVWPLPQQPDAATALTRADLNALERAVWELAIKESRFGAILNEKDPPVVPGSPYAPDKLPKSYRGTYRNTPN